MEKNAFPRLIYFDGVYLGYSRCCKVQSCLAVRLWGIGLKTQVDTKIPRPLTWSVVFVQGFCTAPVCLKSSSDDMRDLVQC